MFHAVPQIQRAGWVAQRNIIARLGRVNTRGLVAAWSEREERGAAQVCASCKMSRGLPSPRAACREHGRGTSRATMCLWRSGSHGPWSIDTRRQRRIPAATIPIKERDGPRQVEIACLSAERKAHLWASLLHPHAHHDNSKCCCYCRRHFFSDLHFE